MKKYLLGIMFAAVANLSVHAYTLDQDFVNATNSLYSAAGDAAYHSLPQSVTDLNEIYTTLVTAHADYNAEYAIPADQSSLRAELTGAETTIGSLSVDAQSYPEAKVSYYNNIGGMAGYYGAQPYITLENEIGSATGLSDLFLGNLINTLPPAPTPEPATITLAGVGAVGLLVARRRK